jgi:glutaredoxin
LWGLVLLVLVVSAASQWWARYSQQTLGQQVAAAAAPGDIRMLSSDTCALCVVARGWLNEHEVPFTECSIERDAACLQLFEATRSPGTPVMLVRGQPQVGFSPQRVLQGLQAPG